MAFGTESVGECGKMWDYTGVSVGLRGIVWDWTVFCGIWGIAAVIWCYIVYLLDKYS